MRKPRALEAQGFRRALPPSLFTPTATETGWSIEQVGYSNTRPDVEGGPLWFGCSESSTKDTTLL
ncbi:hypothetical protein IC611_02120 [Proteus mirabilis]